MRWEKDEQAARAPLEFVVRRIERADRLEEVAAPRHWTSARIEAWLDWADGLARDFPRMDLPEALQPQAPYDPLLGTGPDRYARRAAAWGLKLGLFDMARRTPSPSATPCSPAWSTARRRPRRPPPAACGRPAI